MPTEKIQGRAILAGFVIAGALVLALSLPSQAADQTFLGETIVPSDSYYLKHKADYNLKSAVKNEIALSPYVDGQWIRVTVRDGVVTLRGAVEDQSAAEAAIRNAREAGAKKVINKLTIEENK
jgi:osmotically-inducible protein OsmY